jgi:cell division GTPase FtsZ
MKVLVVGVGQAGGKVADALLEYEARTRTSFVSDALAVNTARVDLLGLKTVDVEHRLLIGQSRVKGHGVGADNRTGVEIAREDKDDVLQAVDELATHETDAFLIVAGLGGGTGSGAAPVIAQELSRMYTEPVYGLGILPGRDEGGIYTLNAARSFRTFVREVDNLVLFDNDAWRNEGESLQSGFATINAEIARRFGVLFSAGESRAGAVPETVVDASEVINTLSGGGISTVGYATSKLDRAEMGILSRLGGKRAEVDELDAVNRITSTVRRAALGRLTLPCDIHSAGRALVVVSGPPEYLSRKGIENARRWLEESTGTMEIRGGDYPVPDSEHVAALVLLSGIRNAPRLDELDAIAVETRENLAAIEAENANRLRAPWEGEGGIDPLF